MAFLRPSSSPLRAAVLRPTLRAAATPRAALQSYSTTPRRLAQQDYGSTDSSPKAASTEPSSGATREKEHPGAPPPDVGQTKASSSSSSSASSTSNSSSSGNKDVDGSQKGNSAKDSHAVKGARPRILDENPPSKESEDVKQHNREMDNRAERADTQIGNEEAEKDKVPPGFWSGQGGRTGG